MISDFDDSSNVIFDSISYGKSFNALHGDFQGWLPVCMNIRF